MSSLAQRSYVKRIPTVRKTSVNTLSSKKVELTEDEQTFLGKHFKNYETIIEEWIHQESIKYKPKSKRTFKMLTLPKLINKELEQKKLTEEQVKEKIKLYMKWQEIVNHNVIRFNIMKNN